MTNDALRDELRELLHKVCLVLDSHPDELSVKDVAALVTAYATLMGANGGFPDTVHVTLDKEVEQWAK